jgi:methenyltetrahydromethanopterin cyclohydrolase
MAAWLPQRSRGKTPVNLNQRALDTCQQLFDDPDQLRVLINTTPGGTRIVDCGLDSDGGLEAGRIMAETCLAGLGTVALGPGDPAIWNGPWVHVRTDRPVAACMASQYAGWQVSSDDFFAMGSGPMRAARGREPLFARIGNLERAEHAVGILETGRLPGEETCSYLARECHVTTDRLTLLVAPTSSLAGTLQVVARSIETAMHKLFELDFDLDQVVCGFGVAPLPPVAGDDLVGIGRTNDAVLYGSHTTLWVRSEDEALGDLVTRIPSCSSADHGQPFADIFAGYDKDFYKIDPMLFSPARVTLMNLNTGNSFVHGVPLPEVLQRSFTR